MREFSIEDNLKKTLKKLAIKDKATYDAFIDKVNEILNCKDVDHYKNLKKPLQGFKRIHIKGPFVLVFKYIKSEDKVVFYDLDHHDKIYK